MAIWEGRKGCSVIQPPICRQKGELITSRTGCSLRRTRNKAFSQRNLAFFMIPVGYKKESKATLVETPRNGAVEVRSHPQTCASGGIVSWVRTSWMETTWPGSLRQPPSINSSTSDVFQLLKQDHQIQVIRSFFSGSPKVPPAFESAKKHPQNLPLLLGLSL